MEDWVELSKLRMVHRSKQFKHECLERDHHDAKISHRLQSHFLVVFHGRVDSVFNYEDAVAIFEQV